MRTLLICNTDGALYVFRRPIIDRLLAEGHQVFALCEPSYYSDRLQSLGVEVHPVTFPRHSVGMLGNFRLLRDIYRVVSSVRPDVVHSFTHKAAIFGTLAALAAGVKRRFVTITGLGQLFSRSDIRTLILRTALCAQYFVALRIASKTFFQNPDDQALFESFYLLPRTKSVLTAGSCIDLERYPVPSAEAITKARNTLERAHDIHLSGKVLVLLACRAVRAKGVVEFYEAAKRIGSSNHQFIHIGDTDRDSPGALSQSELKSMAIDSGVIYAGQVMEPEDYFVAADIVTLPSRYREGVPRSLIEGLAYDKFVITTDMPGCRETVELGQNGLLVRPGDVEALVSAVTSVSCDVLTRAKGKSRAMAERRFDAQALVSLTLQSYASEA